MITDPKEQKEFFGIESETPDDFKTKFNERYVLKEKAADDQEVRKTVSGNVLGAEMTNIKRFFKENEVEFTEEEVKGFQSLPSHKNEAMIAAGFQKIQGKYVNQIEELKKTAGQGGDEKLKAIETEKEKLGIKLKEVESAWKATASELEKAKSEGASTLKAFKIETQLSEARKGLKIKQKLTEAERLGLDAAISQKLKFELSDKGDLETFNAKGERITSKQKAGDFLNAQEALQDLVNELGLAEINPHGGKPATQGSSWGSGQHQTPAEPTGKTILRGGKPVKV